MSNKRKFSNPFARDGMNRVKTEIAENLGVQSPRDAAAAGLQDNNMVNKMLADYESEAETTGTATIDNPYNT